MNDDTLEARIREGLANLTAAQVCELAGAIDRLVVALSPERIYAFGSHVRGDATADSDVDLLIVVPDSDTPAHLRAHAAYEAVGPHRLPLDILVVPCTEFDRRSRAQASLPATVLREGQLLYAA